MVMPRWVARANRVTVNPIARHLAPRAPGMGVIVHRGSRSGREYRTPVFAIATTDGYVFALAYGSRVDWLRNLRAAGGAELRARGRTVHLSDPRILGPERGGDLPWIARMLFTLIGVREYLETTTAG
jgi:deazaflavin-dependent oxidoreductase (nitroreductase family)